VIDCLGGLFNQRWLEKRGGGEDPSAGAIYGRPEEPIGVSARHGHLDSKARLQSLQSQSAMGNYRCGGSQTRSSLAKEEMVIVGVSNGADGAFSCVFE